MKIRISIKRGNDPADGMISTSQDLVFCPQILPEVVLELEGEPSDLLPFFDRLREDGIFQLIQEIAKRRQYG